MNNRKAAFVSIIFLLLFVFQKISAQNTFPATGNAGIGTTAPGIYALSIQGANTDGGATNAPSIHISNTSTFNPAGAGYNVAWMDLTAGNSGIIGQILANYGTGGGSPFSAGSGLYLTTRTAHPIIFATGSPSTEKMRVTAGGSVGIGTINTNDPNYKLFVETGIRTRMIKVDQTAWPDYVFDPAYRLLPLGELNSFINKNRHLPGVASAEEVESEGVDLGANQAVLLKKIEELTLYVITQEKKIKEMQVHLEQIEKKQKQLKAKR